MQFELTDDDAAVLHRNLMQLPNSSGTYPILVRLTNALNNRANQTIEEVELS